MNDGTVLGYTNTGAQTGERIPSRELLDIVEQDVVGFRRLEGETPAHVTIMRDGFMNDPIGEALDYLSNQGIGYDVVEVRKQAKTRLVNRNTTFDHPDRGVAAISTYEPRAVLATYGKPMHGRTDGTPRPITIERTDGTTDIETLARQVYLLSQCHVSSANATLRIPTPVAYADRAATAAANKHLPSTSSLETKLGFL
jgi:argonaute-like protein implicated in RNA metabolism and viral defense